MKEFLLWLKFFRVLLRLVWQARHEKPNRAKVRRIVRAVNFDEV